MNLSGGILDYLIVFWGGVLVSFTPCVYPLLPITASFVAGINTKGTKLMGFIISIIYVLGLALTYSLLGVMAALTGKVFGQVQNNPTILFIVAGILTFFALVLLDVVPFYSFGAGVQRGIKPRNLWTVFLFGMVSGFVVGPCTTPILGTLLLYVATKGNVLHGVSLLFVFSYGVGASLILVGTFSGILSNLPKSGVWLIRIKQFCALVLLIAAAYFFIKTGRLTGLLSF